MWPGYNTTGVTWFVKEIKLFVSIEKLSLVFFLFAKGKKANFKHTWSLIRFSFWLMFMLLPKTMLDLLVTIDFIPHQYYSLIVPLYLQQGLFLKRSYDQKNKQTLYQKCMIIFPWKGTQILHLCFMFRDQVTSCWNFKMVINKFYVLNWLYNTYFCLLAKVLDSLAGESLWILVNLCDTNGNFLLINATFLSRIISVVEGDLWSVFLSLSPFLLHDDWIYLLKKK